MQCGGPQGGDHGDWIGGGGNEGESGRESAAVLPLGLAADSRAPGGPVHPAWPSSPRAQVVSQLQQRSPGPCGLL